MDVLQKLQSLNNDNPGTCRRAQLPLTLAWATTNYYT